MIPVKVLIPKGNDVFFFGELEGGIELRRSHLNLLLILREKIPRVCRDPGAW